MANTNRRSWVTVCSVALTTLGLALAPSAQALVDAQDAPDEGISSSIARVVTTTSEHEDSDDSESLGDSDDSEDSEGAGDSDENGDSGEGSQGDDVDGTDGSGENNSREHSARLHEADDADTPSASLCTGALITPEWVVTAKHCVDKDDAFTTVTFGTSQDGDPVDVDSVVNHHDSDVSLLHLATPAQAEPLKVWGQGKLSSPKDAELFGWGGVDEEGNGKSADFLTTANAEVGTEVSTDRGLVEGMETVEGKISDGAKSTRGDSGAPFIIDGKIYGILSQGIVDDSGDATATSSTLLTPLQGYAEWVNDTVESKVIDPEGSSSGDNTSPASRGGGSTDRGFATTDRSSGNHNGANRGGGNTSSGNKAGGGKSKASAFAKGKNATASANAKPGHAKSSARAGGKLSDAQLERIRKATGGNTNGNTSGGAPVAVANAQAGAK